MNEKWCFLPYDMDTAIGINNEGLLAFGYDLEDIDHIGTGEDVFNGQESVLWKNLRAVYFNDIKKMYQDLRSDGSLSYDKVEKAFEQHQAKWSASIFNEDAYFKYIQPLIDDRDGTYLGMCQGSKAEQRKWWLYNRFRYMDSKYNAGDAESDYIQLRGYAKSDIHLIPYADIYASVKFGSYLTQIRASRGQEYTIECPLDNVNDTEIYIYSSSQLLSIGDLSGLKVGFADFSRATKIKDLKLGDASSDYENTNLKSLILGNNTLLKTIDIRNCSGLNTSIDISGCSNIEEVYCEGTSITGIDLPATSSVMTLHLPDTMTMLNLVNQSKLQDFQMDNYSNITTLRIENANDVIKPKILDIFNEMPTNGRVRLLDVDLRFDTLEECQNFVIKLNSMRGLDQNNNTVDVAQISGKMYADTIPEDYINILKTKYPNLEVTYRALKPSPRINTNWLSLSGLKQTSLTRFSIISNFDEPEDYTSKWDASSDSSGTIVGYTIGTEVVITSIAGNKMKYNSTGIVSFSGCSALTSVDLTGLDTSNVTDMNYMFYSCSNLTSIDLTGLDTSSVTKMSYMFSGCSALTSVDLTELDTSNVTDMSSLFSGCTSLTSVDLPELDTSSVTNTMNMFSNCSALTSIDLTGLNTSNVTTMTRMFYNCSNLTSIDLTGLDTSNVTDMSSLFSGCTSLTSVDLPELDTSSVTNMGYMFNYCTSLTTIDLTGLDTSNVTKMSYMFSGCKALTTIDLTGLDTSSVTDMSYMFSSCTSLTSVDLTGLDTSNVTTMSYMFNNCTNLNSYYILSTSPFKLSSYSLSVRASITHIYIPEGSLEAYSSSPVWSDYIDYYVEVPVA